jgi:hypothetical protein
MIIVSWCQFVVWVKGDLKVCRNGDHLIIVFKKLLTLCICDLLW